MRTLGYPESQFELATEVGEGALERLFSESEHRQLDRRIAEIQLSFQQESDWSLKELEQCQRAWVRSHLEKEHVEQTLELAIRARDDFSVLVTIGIGGSDLSARVYHDVLNHPYHNHLSRDQRGDAPEVYFTGDTFDASRLKGLLETLAARKLVGETLFNVISKSGRTGETIATLMIVRDWIQRNSNAECPESWRRQVVATTGLNSNSALYQMHHEHKFYGGTLLPVPEGVGGRFSAFSPVGLFFLAMTAGKGESPRSRVRNALDGVGEADALFQSPFTELENMSYCLARWLHLAEMWAGKNNLVFYNFADNRYLGDWFVQLYDESLQERGQGLNVIAALGPTSNHSVLNGILNGPKDKVVLFIGWRELGDDLEIPARTGIGGDLESFEGLSMNQVQTASYCGTVEEFGESGIPTATLSVPKRDVHNLCKLMRVLMDCVAVKGRLQALHVNDTDTVDFTKELTYCQDGVEGYKERTRKIAAAMKLDADCTS
ncbi:MAG: hypothetical protein OXN17_21575 [Candidatus Poribacteria bacterium]|nr:hypothetical protein [Candidatus Poribacteria bacterium]MDE0505720.1 hypothetical protein [Candidatus Poribacteria bacterium]